MHTILHKITIETSPENVYKSLTTEEGLSSWWTEAKSDNDHISFFFGPNKLHLVVMKSIKCTPQKEVRWKCVDGPWIDTGDFIFDITQHERGACLDFAHEGWREQNDFFKHCNSKWGYFLVVSLKQFLETGKGAPHPADPSI